MKTILSCDSIIQFIKNITTFILYDKVFVSVTV